MHTHDTWVNAAFQLLFGEKPEHLWTVTAQMCERASILLHCNLYRKG